MLPYTRSAVIGGIFLGLGRALGETMAVTFVIGNAHELTASLLMPGNSIAATIANEFAEADSEIYRSSLIALGFVLFLRHLHRARHRAPDAAPALAQGRQLMASMDSRSYRSPARRRTALAHGARRPPRRSFGLFWLVWILWTTLHQRHRRRWTSTCSPR